MAVDKSKLSFEEIVKASRKKDNERLAQSIFGRDRRSSAPSALGKRNKNEGIPSLASRVGVSKPAQRAKSSRDLKAKAAAVVSRPSPLNQELGNTGTLASRVGNAPPSAPTAPKARNISIRGLAGPAIVMGSNFAPGTTAADIQSAMEPVGGQIQSCRIISARPTVICEMVFSDRSGAEAVIETFNNQKADGRLLYLYLKTGPGGQNLVPPSQPLARSDLSRSPQLRSQQPAARYEDEENFYEADRAAVRAKPEYQDGRYGFGNNREEDVDMDTDARRDNARDERRYDNDRRDEVRDDRHNDRPIERSFQSQGGSYSTRYDRPVRDNRLYSDRMNYQGGRGFR